MRTLCPEARKAVDESEDLFVPIPGHPGAYAVRTGARAVNVIVYYLKKGSPIG